MTTRNKSVFIILQNIFHLFSNSDSSEKTQTLIVGSSGSKEDNFLYLVDVNLTNSMNRFEIKKKIAHDGGIKKARYMP